MNLFQNVSIKTRLWLIMCFMALGLLIEGGLGLSGIVISNKALDAAYQDSLEPTRMVNRIMHLMGENRAQVMLWLQHNAEDHSSEMHGDDPSVTHSATIFKNRDEITALVAEYRKRNLTVEEQELADKYAAARALYVNEGLLPAVKALQEADYPKANKILLQKLNPYYESANAEAVVLLQKILETARIRYDHAEKRYAMIRNAVIGSTLLGLLLGTIAATLLIRSIMLPLNRAVGHFKDIAKGNLSENIAVSGRDEIGQVLGALSAMQGKLKVTIEELDRLASTDKLTGSWNRRRLEETVKNEMDRLKRYDHPLCLMVLDIDFFKKVNDRYGHGTGDFVLIELAALVRSSLRTSDALARWGGEEFVVLCPNTMLPTAALLAERLRNKIAGASFPEVGQVTVSVGVAECLPEETFEQWFKRADEALYRAKSGGRNQVQIAPKTPDRAGAGESAAVSFVQLVWNKSYESGNEVIDHEHQVLFRDANELLAAILSGRPVDMVEVIINTLIRDVVKHFQDEEAILVKAGYPRVAEHAAIHRKLADNAVMLVEKFHTGTLGIGELFNFLAHDVVAKHILGADREFIPYLDAGR
jgi:diguanylate cyclase (GGDEF)-like protein/hemerythrin-like metal-binding protein